MQNNQAIFESIFNRNFSDADSYTFLKELSETHPYFSPAQFFLLRKTEEGSAEFEKQVAKTNLFFNNPHWLHYRLSENAGQIKTFSNFEAAPVVEHQAEQKIETFANEPEMVDSPDNTDANGQMEEEIEPMKIELKMPEAKLDLDEAMLFEPMHVVDYFASQGIKLSDDVQTGDKLGKQLKSFTEWLKTMKKVHEENAVEAAGEPDTNIVTMAENSNKQADVLTESMAEVFIKQGKTGKAGEVYRKLSLLNPAKSAYFAAKLENLKEL